jgi:hypothetical protein
MSKTIKFVQTPRDSYSITRYAFSFIWIFTAFLVAQVADGYQFKITYALLFCAIMGAVAGRIKSAFALGAYVGFSILLAHFVIATYSINYSSELFYPSFWGPLDLVLMAMMWTAPLFVLLADSFDRKISRALTARIFRALEILKAVIYVPINNPKRLFVEFTENWSDQCAHGVKASRAPPLLIK